MVFEVNEHMLEALDEYHEKTMLMERHVIEGRPFDGCLESAVNDDLIWNVPIYDMGSRRYAAFCSLTEALWRGDKDVKGNGQYFKHEIESDFDWFVLFYLFRLCGSGINYVPKKQGTMFEGLDLVIGTHGFGNFWIVNSILNGKFKTEEWLEDLRNLNKPFTDNKGYLLPQFSFEGITSGHLKKFILEYSIDLVIELYEYCLQERRQIYQITDYGNAYLNRIGFKKQNFVLTAFAADLAEYFPHMVDPKSFVYAGTNATKCIKAIFPKVGKVKEFDYINSVLQFQSDRYGLNPIDCEDSRNCDMVRYVQEFQSKAHIEKNGTEYKNNSILKSRVGLEKYYEISRNIKT